jgi:hypothetical protein
LLGVLQRCDILQVEDGYICQGGEWFLKSKLEVMSELAPLFDNRCYVTHKPFSSKGFTIHHIEEIENDVLRSNYRSNNYVNDMNQYYTDLQSLVEENPNRFAMITNPIHRKLDGYRVGVTRLKMENRVRFCDLALRTVHLRGKKK